MATSTGKTTHQRPGFPSFSGLILLTCQSESAHASLQHSLQRAASRRVMILIVNYTTEALEIDSETTQLWRGKWGSDSAVPEVIKPGGSVMWRCLSARVGQGIEGSVTYHFAGQVPHDRVRCTWKNRYFGPNKYSAETSREGCNIVVEGGQGRDAFVAFVIGGY